MQVSIDYERCTGHGRCYSLAATVFDSDEAGRGVVMLSEVPPELQGEAHRAAANCPERAIELSEGAGRQI